MKLSEHDKKLIQDFLKRSENVHLRTTGGKKNWVTRPYRHHKDDYGKTRSNSK